MKIKTLEELKKADCFKVGGLNDAYAKFFVGKSYLASLTDPKCGLYLANVTFEPGCRNNYHVHRASRGGGQILIVTAGEGWYVDDEKSIELCAGDVITIPPGIRHWHGAKSDSFLSHIAAEIPGENTSTEWLDPVGDEEYFDLECRHGSNKTPSNGLSEAKKLLGDKVRLAIRSGQKLLTSEKMGIAPLVDAVDGGECLGCVAADRIVGKAAALLYALLGAKEVFGSVMSVEGEKTLTRFGIAHSCKTLTKFIRNRSGDGICPMEQTVSDIDDPHQALIALKATLARLRK